MMRTAIPSAMLEGNTSPKQWGGKPIPIYRVWSYKIEIVDRRQFWAFNHSMVGSDGTYKSSATNFIPI